MSGERYIDPRLAKFNSMVEKAGEKQEIHKNGLISLKDYSKLPNSDKKKIFYLFEKAGLNDTKSAQYLKPEQIVEKFTAFCKEINYDQVTKVMRITLQDGSVFEGSKGNFIGAGFSYKKTKDNYRRLR